MHHRAILDLLAGVRLELRTQTPFGGGPGARCAPVRHLVTGLRLVLHPPQNLVMSAAYVAHPFAI